MARRVTRRTAGTGRRRPAGCKADDFTSQRRPNDRRVRERVPAVHARRSTRRYEDLCLDCRVQERAPPWPHPLVGPVAPVRLQPRGRHGFQPRLLERHRALLQGLPRSAGMSEKWDKRFLNMAALVSSWSKDPSTQVGAVIVDDQRVVVGTGYNGFPRGAAARPERDAERETKYKMIARAEANAVYAAGSRARGGTINVYPTF